jgi:hypothetical protein
VGNTGNSLLGWLKEMSHSFITTLRKEKANHAVEAGGSPYLKFQTASSAGIQVAMVFCSMEGIMMVEWFPHKTVNSEV